MRMLQEEAFEDGFENGWPTGIQTTIKLCLHFNLSHDNIIQQLITNFQFFKDDARKYIHQYAASVTPSNEK